MDIKDLKSAWEKYSLQEMDKHRLEKENIQELLKKRTKNLLDLVDRNIRIGVGILLLFLAYVLIDSLYLSKLIVNGPIHYPEWLMPIDVFSNFLIVSTFLFFVLRYFKTKRTFAIDHHLNKLLKGIVETLTLYRRLFYLAVGILIVNLTVSFAAGLYQGVKYGGGSVPEGIQSISGLKILAIIGVGLAVLIPLVLLTFFLLRWGFNKLYGRYLVQLNDTLNELDENTPE